MTEKYYKNLLKDEMIRYRPALNLPKHVTFGIEIEYENILKDKVSLLLKNKQLDKKLIGWKNKSEIDIKEYDNEGEECNGEINSPILTDSIETWKSLREMLILLKVNDGIVTEKCGGHVNIGAHLLSNANHFKQFILLWILYEKEIYKFSSGQFRNIRPDRNNLFQRISSNFDVNDKISLSVITNLISTKFYDIHVRTPVKNKIMFNNVIEFRIPNGTLDEEIWQNYINFFARFILASKKELDEEKLIYKINKKQSNAVELADFVFDNDIDKENFLIQALKTNKIYRKVLPKHISLN